jgi:zinc protease
LSIFRGRGGARFRRTVFRGLTFGSLLLGGALAQPVAAQQFESQGFTLDNGLQVVVLPSHRVAAVTLMVWYKVGAADDPRGKSGIAHFLEHLMFKGTKTVPPGGFAAQIAQNGGRDNAFTAEDYTAFYETVAKDRLDMVLRLEADRMTGLAIDDDAVNPERKVILEERRMRIDNEPGALLAEQLTASLFLNASYHNPTIGWESEMRGLGTGDALAFYRRWYAPNNAVLVIAGDTSAAEVKPLAERFFGPLAARRIPDRLRLEEPPHHAPARLEMKSARAAQPSWRRYYLAPSHFTGETKYAYPLEVLAEILGGGNNSRLYQSLVLKQRLALSASADYAPAALGPAIFTISAAARNGVDIGDLEAAIDAELRDIVTDGVTEDEVKRARTRMQSAAIYARDSLSGPANIVGAALALGRKIEDVTEWPERIGKVTAAEIQAAAKAVLVERNSATGILLPEHTS